MALWSRWRKRAPRASALEEWLRNGGGGNVSASGASVTPTSAMRVAAVYASVRIISGAVATLPLQIKRRVDNHTREEATEHELTAVLGRRPNSWQTPSQFRRMMQAHVLLRGNAYGAIITSLNGRVSEIFPLNPDRVTVTQDPSGALSYKVRLADGGEVDYPQDKIFHIVGMTLDGVHGVSPITFARESIGLALSMENHGATMFRHGARVSGVLTHPDKLSDAAAKHLRESVSEFAAGGENEGKNLVLEEGMKYERMALSAEDAQWIESRKFSRTDIAMFFGVPPHMIGDTEKATSWGSGIEQQSIGFVSYTLEDHLTTWEESIARDLIPRGDTDIYARFNRNALVRGDLRTRTESYVKSVQWGLLSPDEIRALEDHNPRADGKGGTYYDPPNTAGGETPTSNENERQNND